MGIKKSQIYSQLWNSCNALRGGMDASQYKDYILTLLFVKCTSDKYDKNPKGNLQAPLGGHFKDIIALKNNKDIGNGINIVIGELAKANDLTGVIDIADFNDDTKFGKGQEMIDKLTKLIGVFENMLNLDGTAEGDDLLGDAYEYLMRKFATESGKAKGQFYTPAEASIVLSGLLGLDKVKKKSTTLYDPTCGSGSLLIKGNDTAPNGLTIYGQEKDIATTALTKMNMLLHGCAEADIAPGGHSTLAEPYFKETIKSPEGGEIVRLKQFDFIVSNPPFSLKNWTDGVFSKSEEQDQKKKSADIDPWERFNMGIPPTKNGDYAWLLHIYKSMEDETGKAAVILPHGVLFRGGSEQQIRTALINSGVIKAIIGLPANLFYGTGIPACIIVMDKENVDTREGVFFIDASRGFIKDGNKNRLRQQDIHKILDTFNNLKTENHYSKMISKKTIIKNEYNLNISRYIESPNTEDIHDINAHLNGGVPRFDVDSEYMKNYWIAFPNLKNKIFEKNKKDCYFFKIKSENIRQVIVNHADLTLLKNDLDLKFNDWVNLSKEKLTNIKFNLDVKKFVEDLSEDLLKIFDGFCLINKYSIYQQFMEYWNNVMLDDVYLIKQEGYLKASGLKVVTEDADIMLGNGKNSLKYKSDIIPSYLIAEKYFKKDLSKIEELSDLLNKKIEELSDLEQENSGEDELFNEVMSEKEVSIKLKEVKKNNDLIDEKLILENWLSLKNEEKKLKEEIKLIFNELQKKLLKIYTEQFDENLVINLIVYDKWINTLKINIDNIFHQLISELTNKLQELWYRYGETLNNIEEELNKNECEFKKYLEQMGFKYE